MLTGSASSVDVTTLLGYTRFLANTLDNVSAFPDASIVALLNLDYRETQSFLLSQIMYDWKENTVNGTSSGLINLVAGTNNVAFPSGLLTIDRVEINYTGGTNTWEVAEPIRLDEFDTAISNTSGNVSIKFGTGKPRYWVRDGRIYIDPIPNQSVTGGMKVWCTTLITDLAVGESVGPVFASPFHKLLAMGAAIQYLITKTDFTKAREIERQRNELRSLMVQFYTGRQADDRPNLSPRTRCLD